MLGVRRHKAVVVLGCLLLAAVVACGGTSTPLTPEEALTKRAEAQNVEFSRGDGLEAYKYLSSRSREVCTNGDYAAKIGIEMAMFGRIFGIPEDAKLTITVERVTVDGNVGHVHPGDLLRDGEPIEFGDDSDEGEGQRWVFVDGEWWFENEDLEST